MDSEANTALELLKLNYPNYKQLKTANLSNRAWRKPIAVRFGISFHLALLDNQSSAY